MLRFLTYAAYFAAGWYFTEYFEPKEAIRALAALTFIAFVTTSENIIRLAEVIDRHAKRLFPEAFDE